MKNHSMMNKIFYSYILIILFIILLVGVAILPLQLKKMNQDLETTILENAALLATDVSIREGIERKKLDTSLKKRLDDFIASAENMDYIVIADTNSIRLYHPNPDLIGQSFVGGDQMDILEGAAPYITTASGKTTTQKRAFHQIVDTDGKIIGFIMVSASLDTIHKVQQTIILHFVIILIIILLIGILFSFLLSKSIRKQLMGFEPTIFTKMYLQREEILDTLEESIVAINLEGQYLYRNPAADKFCPKQLNLFQTSLVSKLNICIQDRVSVDGLLTEIGNDTFLVNLIPLIKHGQCEGILIIARDKTELTQMAEQLTGMNHIIDAVRANTHEYMNKLHVISGLLQIGETEQALSFINENATEIENGHKIVIRQIQNKTIAALIIGKMNRAKELNIQFVFQKESSLDAHNAFLSTKELITIIGNLVENAFDAMKIKKDFCQVELMIRSDDDGITITVDDTGCGMTEEQIERIYSGQYTSKGSGHGYGLRLIQEIVHAQNGFFTIDSELGEGSSISVVINKKRKFNVEYKEEEEND